MWRRANRLEELGLAPGPPGLGPGPGPGPRAGPGPGLVAGVGASFLQRMSRMRSGGVVERRDSDSELTPENGTSRRVQPSAGIAACIVSCVAEL